MAPHSSTFAWKIPWTEEPGRLQSMGSLESDTTELLRFHFSLSCIGEGNGNLLQCSCLENPRDGKPGWLPSMGSHRVRHNWSDAAAAADCSTPGFPVLYYLPKFASTHLHWVGDAIQPSHPLLPPSPPALNPSQHQGLFQRIGSMQQVVKVLQL